MSKSTRKTNPNVKAIRAERKTRAAIRASKGNAGSVGTK